MPLPSCRRCGKTDPRRMYGLMTLWFGPFVEVPPDHGYFYLCPACYDRFVVPHLETIREKVAELHPAMRRKEHEHEEERARLRGEALAGDSRAAEDEGPGEPVGDAPENEVGPVEGSGPDAEVASSEEAGPDVEAAPGEAATQDAEVAPESTASPESEEVAEVEAPPDEEPGPDSSEAAESDSASDESAIPDVEAAPGKEAGLEREAHRPADRGEAASH